MTNLRHMSKVRPMTAPSHYDDGLDDLTDGPPELDYAYDPGRGEHMAGWA